MNPEASGLKMQRDRGRQEPTHTLRHNLSVSLMAHQIISWGKNFDTPTYLQVRCCSTRLGVWVRFRG